MVEEAEVAEEVCIVNVVGVNYMLFSFHIIINFHAGIQHNFTVGLFVMLNVKGINYNNKAFLEEPFFQSCHL